MKWGLATRKNNQNNSSLDAFHRDIDRVFDDFFSFTPSTFFESQWIPSIDVSEDEKAITVKAEVPGIDEKNINVILEENVLTISGEKQEERKDEDRKRNYVMSERRFGSFSRSIALPDGIKADQIKADFSKGVLTVRIPKEESARPKRIQIQVQ